MNSSRSTSPGCSGGNLVICSSSVIVDDFDVFGGAVVPHEANPDPVVDPDCVLSRPGVKERVQFVPWRTSQVPKLVCGLHHSKLTASNLDKVSREALRALALVDRLRYLVPEAPDWH